jgi:hypothetical protein
VGVQGPYTKTKWSHIPITFSQEDLRLKDYPHRDDMVILCVIKGFIVHNVLVDTGSATNIIFAKAFKQMQELEDKNPRLNLSSMWLRRAIDVVP